MKTPPKVKILLMALLYLQPLKSYSANSCYDLLSKTVNRRGIIDLNQKLDPTTLENLRSIYNHIKTREPRESEQLWKNLKEYLSNNKFERADLKLNHSGDIQSYFKHGSQNSSYHNFNKLPEIIINIKDFLPLEVLTPAEKYILETQIVPTLKKRAEEFGNRENINDYFTYFFNVWIENTLSLSTFNKILKHYNQNALAFEKLAVNPYKTFNWIQSEMILAPQDFKKLTELFIKLHKNHLKTENQNELNWISTRLARAEVLKKLLSVQNISHVRDLLPNYSDLSQPIPADIIRLFFDKELKSKEFVGHLTGNYLGKNLIDIPPGDLLFIPEFKQFIESIFNNSSNANIDKQIISMLYSKNTSFESPFSLYNYKLDNSIFGHYFENIQLLLKYLSKNPEERLVDKFVYETRLTNGNSTSNDSTHINGIEALKIHITQIAKNNPNDLIKLKNNIKGDDLLERVVSYIVNEPYSQGGWGKLYIEEFRVERLKYDSIENRLGKSGSFEDKLLSGIIRFLRFRIHESQISQVSNDFHEFNKSFSYYLSTLFTASSTILNIRPADFNSEITKLNQLHSGKRWYKDLQEIARPHDIIELLTLNKIAVENADQLFADKTSDSSDNLSRFLYEITKPNEFMAYDQLYKKIKNELSLYSTAETHQLMFGIASYFSVNKLNPNSNIDSIIQHLKEIKLNSSVASVAKNNSLSVMLRLYLSLGVLPSVKDITESLNELNSLNLDYNDYRPYYLKLESVNKQIDELRNSLSSYNEINTFNERMTEGLLRFLLLVRQPWNH